MAAVRMLITQHTAGQQLATIQLYVKKAAHVLLIKSVMNLNVTD